MNLRFGTAGMRAPVGPADHQMNVTTVTRITAGVARWLADQAAQSPTVHSPGLPQDAGPGIGSGFHADDPALRVVVGFDNRYGSYAFATTAAEVFAGAGFEVFLMPSPTPTPMVPWLVRQWDLDGGVQITASHNPAADNGYKVYASDGRLLGDEGALEIERLIDDCCPTTDIPRVFVRPAPDQLRRYVDDVISLVEPHQADLLRVNNERANIRIALTAMHGVGGRAIMQTLQAAGFAHIFPVTEQHYPDPTFPTVDYPNPEEPAAVARVLSLGNEVDADIVIALDPDADRCAVGVRSSSGELFMLRGDETGALLATRLVPKFTGEGERPIVSTTYVSTQLLPTIAKDRGWDLRHTFTGFKNLMSAAGDRTVAFATEEAVGIAPAPHLVDDKDGIATALVACAWAAELKGRGLTLADELDALHRAYGYFVGKQISVRTVDPNELITAWAHALPEEMDNAKLDISTLADAAGYSALKGIVIRASHADGEVRVIARPSGTEKKAKFYVEVNNHDSKERARQLLMRVCTQVEALIKQL